MINKKHLWLLTTIMGTGVLFHGITLEASFHSAQASAVRPRPWGGDCRQEQKKCRDNCNRSMSSTEDIKKRYIDLKCKLIYKACKTRKQTGDDQFDICKENCQNNENKQNCIHKCEERKRRYIRKNRERLTERPYTHVNGPNGIT